MGFSRCCKSKPYGAVPQADPEEQVPLAAAPPGKEPRQWKGPWYNPIGDGSASDVASCCLAFNVPAVAFGWNSGRAHGLTWWKEALKFFALTGGIFMLIRVITLVLLHTAGPCKAMMHDQAMMMPQGGPAFSHHGHGHGCFLGKMVHGLFHDPPPPLPPVDLPAADPVSAGTLPFNPDDKTGPMEVVVTSQLKGILPTTSTEEPVHDEDHDEDLGDQEEQDAVATTSTDADSAMATATASTDAAPGNRRSLKHHDHHHKHEHKYKEHKHHEHDDDDDDDDDDDKDEKKKTEKKKKSWASSTMDVRAPQQVPQGAEAMVGLPNHGLYNYNYVDAHEAHENFERCMEHVIGPAAAAMLSVGIACTCFAVFYAAKRRTQMRQRFGIQGSFKEDAALWCCCGPCALAQETRTLMHNNVEEGMWHGPLSQPLVVPHQQQPMAA